MTSRPFTQEIRQTPSSLKKVLKWLRPVARTVDRGSTHASKIFARGVGTYAVALISMLVGAAMPMMEFVPFGANAAGILLTVFGLALTVHNGLLAWRFLT